jgi:hypothetical protein
MERGQPVIVLPIEKNFDVNAGMDNFVRWAGTENPCKRIFPGTLGKYRQNPFQLSGVFLLSLVQDILNSPVDLLVKGE